MENQEDKKRDEEFEQTFIPDEIRPVEMPDSPTHLRPVPPGYVVMAQADKDGNEIPGTEFIVKESGYLKRYNNERFILKKKKTK